MKADVAVIIPTNNRAALTLRAIQSVLNQTKLPEEILVIDDGSNDSNYNELITGTDKYRPLLKVIKQSHQGASVARNTGIEASTASLLVFLDSDDILVPESIERRLFYLKNNPDVGGVFHDYRTYDNNGKPFRMEIDRPYHQLDDLFIAFAKYASPACASTLMIRRTSLPAPPYFDPGLSIAEDWDFLLRVLDHCDLRYIDEPFARVTIHPFSMTNNTPEFQKSDQIITVQNRVSSLHKFATLMNTTQADILCSHTVLRARSKRKADGWKSLKKAFRIAPFYWKVYAALLLLILGTMVSSSVMKVYRRLKK